MVIEVSRERSLDELWEQMSVLEDSKIDIVFKTLDKKVAEDVLKLVASQDVELVNFFVDETLLQTVNQDELLEFYMFLVEFVLYSPFATAFNNILELLAYDPRTWDINNVARRFFSTENVNFIHTLIVAMVREKLQKEVLKHVNLS